MWRHGARTHMDRIQHFDGGLAAIDLVQHFVDFSVGSFPDGLRDLPGV